MQQYDLSSFHIYGTIFDGATFERGLDPQKIQLLIRAMARRMFQKSAKLKKGVFRDFDFRLFMQKFTLIVIYHWKADKMC